MCQIGGMRSIPFPFEDSDDFFPVHGGYTVCQAFQFSQETWRHDICPGRQELSKLDHQSTELESENLILLGHSGNQLGPLFFNQRIPIAAVALLEERCPHKEFYSHKNDSINTYKGNLIHKRGPSLSSL